MKAEGARPLTLNLRQDASGRCRGALKLYWTRTGTRLCLVVTSEHSTTTFLAATMDEYDEAVLFTFALLESRLDRLEYVLGGSKKPTEERPKTVPERIQSIEKSLQALSARTALLNDAQQLRAFPEPVEAAIGANGRQ